MYFYPEVISTRNKPVLPDGKSSSADGSGRFIIALHDDWPGLLNVISAKSILRLEA